LEAEILPPFRGAGGSFSWQGIGGLTYKEFKTLIIKKFFILS
jgi:hypothetical protein